MTAEDRFWSRIEKTLTCWLWRGNVHFDGYGRLSVGGTWTKAHRFSWSLAHGPIPERGIIAHHCDVPLCVRPEHLFLTDIAGNNADMRAKGRQARGDRHWSRTHPERVPRGETHSSRTHPDRMPRGETHGMTSLTNAEVVAIRERYARGGITMKALGQMYDVGTTTVFHVIHRQTWGHV